MSVVTRRRAAAAAAAAAADAAGQQQQEQQQQQQQQQQQRQPVVDMPDLLDFSSLLANQAAMQDFDLRPLLASTLASEELPTFLDNTGLFFDSCRGLLQDAFGTAATQEAREEEAENMRQYDKEMKKVKKAKKFFDVTARKMDYKTPKAFRRGRVKKFRIKNDLRVVAAQEEARRLKAVLTLLLEQQYYTKVVDQTSRLANLTAYILKKCGGAKAWEELKCLGFT
jgi:hypothetical protein